MDLTQMKRRLARLHEEANAIRAAATAASRDLSPEEKTALKEKLAAFQNLNDDIASFEAVDAQAALLATPEGRKVAAAPVASPSNMGFASVGQFYKAVANTLSGRVDPRLAQNAPGTFGNEATPADGGYAVPPDARKNIVSLLNSPESLFGRCDVINTTSNIIELVVDVDPDWSSAGITAADVNEGAAIGDSKPVLAQLSLTLTKQAALVYASSEVMEDAENFGGYITSKSAAKLAWKVNARIFTAIMAAGSKITVAKTGGAAAGSAPDLANVEAMWAKMPTQFRANAVWLANPALEASLRAFVIGTTPVYLSANSMATAPLPTLLGRPVIYTELCAAVGTTGDLVLVDPSTIQGAVKSNGFRTDVSKDSQFDLDLVGFRTIMRSAFKSKFAAVITRPDGTTCSNVVCLATRA